MESLERILDPRLLEVYYFSKHPDHNAAWDTIEAPDGRVYIGLCNEGLPGLSAALYVLDPYEKNPEHRLRHLFDVDKVTHDDARDGHIPQSKFHTSMGIGGDGKIYSTTHTTAPGLGRPYWTISQDYDAIPYRYPGSHFLVYDPETEKVEDWGIPIPGDSVYGAVLDWPNRKYYMLSYLRGHLHVLDLNTGLTDDLGRFTRGGQCILFLDRKGRVWSADINGAFVNYDPATSKFERLSISMPRPEGREHLMNSLMDPVYWKDGKWVGTMLFEGRIWVLDTEAESGPSIEDYGMGWGDFLPDSAGQIQPCELQFGTDGKLYYGVAAFLMPIKNYQLGGLRIVQFDMETRERRNMGMVWADERPGFLFSSRFKLPGGKLGWMDSCYYGTGARVVVFDPTKTNEIETPSSIQKRMKFAIGDRELEKRERYDRLFAYATDTVGSDVATSLIKVCGDDFPRGSCAITALAVNSGYVWGGTSGDEAGLFIWRQDSDADRVSVLWKFADAAEIKSVFPCGSGIIGIASGKDGCAGFIFRAETGGKVEKLADLPNGEQPAAAAISGDKLYVLSLSGSIYACALSGSDMAKVAEVNAEDLSAILLAYGNKIFGCIQNGRLFEMNVQTNDVQILDKFIPAPRGRQYDARWESGIASNAKIFGGTSDGYIFELNPEICEVKNLGKPLLSMGLPALALGSEGTLYGAGGRFEGLGHVFKYDSNSGFTDIGALSGQTTLWKTYVIGAMAAGENGIVYIGENDDVSHLWRCSLG